MFRLKTLAIAATAAAIFTCHTHSTSTFGSIWTPAGAGGSWNTTGAGGWSGGVPNAAGAVADFSTNAATAARTITNDGGAAGQTVGSISFAGTSTFSNSLTTGTASSNLKLDNSGAGATITTVAGGTGNNTISVPMVLNDNVTANVNNTTASSAAGSLNLTATMSGPGGFAKAGDGLATFGTGTKTYTGATSITGGRLRMSSAASATATSSFTINGGQLTLITAATYSFGSGNLNLNGTGATTGPFAVFPGAIRNDTGLVVSITNTTVLQSDTLLHVQASAGTGSSASPTGSLTFSNAISGPGKLTFTAPGSNIDQGLLILNGANSYAGGTLVQGGILQVSGAAATLGTGNVVVDNALSSSSIARLSILTGVSNALANGATLSLLGGGTAGVADQNYAILGAGIDDLIAGLILGGVTQTSAGTYGSVASGANFQFDEYFSGTGVVRLAAVVPEASAFLCVGLAGVLIGLGCKFFARQAV